MKPRCVHSWQPLRRGSKRERCKHCKVTYPCTHDCGHFDCMVDTGRKLPDHVTYIPPKLKKEEMP